MLTRFLTRTQPDPITPPPTQPQIRVLTFAPPVRDLVTVCDGIDGVRILVQRHGADSVQRWLWLIAAQTGEAL